MKVYYNEFDKKKCAALKALMEDGHISKGDIDDRSITEVKADDLKGYTRCHFFAGIGVWDYALQLVGWPEDREVWSGSCPCQSFSNAGKRKGMDDERHLWPHWFRLIAERKPLVVFGEQVEAAINHGWLDLVQTDMEGKDYAFTAKGIPAAGVGAPHIRQRLWFVADNNNKRQQRDGCAEFTRITKSLRSDQTSWLAHHHHHEGSQGREGMPERTGERTAGADGVAGGMELPTSNGRQQRGSESGRRSIAGGCVSVGLGNSAIGTCERNSGTVFGEETKISGEGEFNGNFHERPEYAGAGVGGLEHPEGERCGEAGRSGGRSEERSDNGCQQGGMANNNNNNTDEQFRTQDFGNAELAGGGETMRPGPLNGFWRDADWLFCRDGKWRPVKSGTFPLAHGYPERVGLLHCAGDAIVAEVAKVFIESYLDVEESFRYI